MNTGCVKRTINQNLFPLFNIRLRVVLKLNGHWLNEGIKLNISSFQSL